MEISKGKLIRAVLQEIKKRLANGEVTMESNLPFYMGQVGFTDKDAVRAAVAEIKESGFTRITGTAQTVLATGKPFDYLINEITEAGQNYLDSGAGLG